MTRTYRVPREVSIEREKRTWELRQQMWAQERIAIELGISQSAVSQILKRLSKRYTQKNLDDVGRVKGEQVAQLEYVADEAMQAWHRSKEAAKIVKQKKYLDAETTASLGSVEQTNEARDQDGDPRYLTTALKAKEDIRKIIGADAPIKSEIAGKDGAPIATTVQASFDRIATLLKQAGDRRDNAPCGADREGSEEVESSTGSAN